jgi:hypothetical protein
MGSVISAIVVLVVSFSVGTNIGVLFSTDNFEMYDSVTEGVLGKSTMGVGDNGAHPAKNKNTVKTKSKFFHIFPTIHRAA